MKDRKKWWQEWISGWGFPIVIIFVFNAICFVVCDSPDCNHRFLLTKIAVQIFIVATAIAGVVFHFSDYVNMNKANDKTVRMQFNHFRDVFYINPDRWYLIDDKLWYKNGKAPWMEERYCVIFTYRDWLKFLIWHKLRNYEKKIELKKTKEEASNMRLAEMLKYIQKDIDEAYEKIGKIKGE